MTLQNDITPHGTRKNTRHRKPQAMPVPRDTRPGADLLIALENLFVVFRCDPWAVVADGQGNHIMLAGQLDQYQIAAVGDGILNQIGSNLMKLQLIEGDRVLGSTGMDLQTYSMLCKGLDLIVAFFN